MAQSTGDKSSSNRNGLMIGIGAVVLLALIVFLVWWLMFRDDAAESVDSDAAAEARAQAIAEATDDTGDTASAATDDTDTYDDDAEAQDDSTSEAAESETELDSGQPDAAAQAGSPADGTWTVDTSIGAFDSTCLEEVCNTTFVGFRINEELAGFGAKTVIGRTGGVTGTMQVIGTEIVSADIVADMTQLLTDNDGRTNALKGAAGGLETNTFPEARFTLTEPIDLGTVPVEGASIQVIGVGDLTVHGVTQPVQIPLTAELQAGVVVVFGSLENIPLTDFDIPTPTSVVVLSVEDHATMELQLFFSR